MTPDARVDGIIAFQNEEYYYPLSVARVADRTVVQLEKHAGTQTGTAGLIVSSAPVDARNGEAKPGVKIQLVLAVGDVPVATRKSEPGGARAYRDRVGSW